jgi:SAM-dependent methyltransferase
VTSPFFYKLGSLIPDMLRAISRSNCPACGTRSRRVGESAICPELAAQWELSPEWLGYFNAREGRKCEACGANLRSLQLAEGINAAVRQLTGAKARSLREFCATPQARALKIAEINSAGGLHPVLAQLPELRYSEYGSDHFPSENLLDLSYPDSSLDLVITSDSLEHLPDVEQALREIGRVLRPGGMHVFTIPVIGDGRKTRCRASMQNGQLVHHLPPSYHGLPGEQDPGYLVFFEFGNDVEALFGRCGFTLRKLVDRKNPALVTYLTTLREKQPNARPVRIRAGKASKVAKRPDPIPEPELEIPDGPHHEGHVYDQDCLRSVHNHEFMDDPRFQRAYARGVQAAGEDYHWHWRVHVGLWAAATASTLEGDFVECGVNRGFLSSAIMDYLDWDIRGKHFYLLDTFAGIDERYLSDQDKMGGAMEKNQAQLDSGFYVRGVESVRRNFAQWRNVSIIEGAVPETLSQVGSKKVAFLSLDMNCSTPEVAALEFFWDRLVPGALILMDDYAYHGYRSQFVAMNALARRKGAEVLSLPTGQGLMVKPS